MLTLIYASNTDFALFEFVWHILLRLWFLRELRKVRFCPLASDVKEGKADKKAIDGEENQYGGNEGKDDGGDAEAGKTEMQEQEHYDQGRYDDDLSAQISETTEEDLFHGIHELPMKEQEELDKVAIFEWVITLSLL